METKETEQELREIPREGHTLHEQGVQGLRKQEIKQNVSFKGRVSACASGWDVVRPVLLRQQPQKKGINYRVIFARHHKTVLAIGTRGIEIPCKGNNHSEVK